MSTTRAQILEALATAIPRTQQAIHFAEAARADAVAVLDSLVTLERSLRPAHTNAGRAIDDLGAAAIRHGLTLAALGHLSAITAERLLQLTDGAQPTGNERRVLSDLLPDWDGAR